MHHLISAPGESLDHRQVFKLRLENICKKSALDQKEPKWL